MALPDQHVLALSAMRAGDRAALVQALRDDIQQGVDQVRTALERGEERGKECLERPIKRLIGIDVGASLGRLIATWFRKGSAIQPRLVAKIIADG